MNNWGDMMSIIVGKILCFAGRHDLHYLTTEEIAESIDEVKQYQFDLYCTRCGKCFKTPILWYVKLKGAEEYIKNRGTV
jgi:hypothetical protein